MNPLEKIFAVLEAVISHQENGLTFAGTVASTALAKASVHRILKGMTELGYLNFNPETKRYFGSLRLASLGAEVMANFQLRDHVRPHLLELNRETEHTSNLAILDGTMGVYVDKVESKDFGIKLISEIGKTFPLYCTGLGKALLSFSSDGTMAKLLETPLKTFTERTITDPKKLKRELALIRDRGYALDNEEITRGIMCVAAPVFGIQNDVVCCISTTFPSYINDERGMDKEIEVIKRHADAISGKIDKGLTLNSSQRG